MNTIEFRASVQGGVIQVPREYQQDLQDAGVIKVIIQKTARKKRISNNGIIARLIQNPIRVENFQPLSREEAHERN